MCGDAVNNRTALLSKSLDRLPRIDQYCGDEHVQQLFAISGLCFVPRMVFGPLLNRLASFSCRAVSTGRQAGLPIAYCVKRVMLLRL